MARRRAEAVADTPDASYLLRRAARRLGPGVDLNRRLWLKYGADVDMLTIRFKERPRPTRSTSAPERGLIYNYEGSRLVSIEILDISD